MFGQTFGVQFCTNLPEREGIGYHQRTGKEFSPLPPGLTTVAATRRNVEKCRGFGRCGCLFFLLSEIGRKTRFIPRGWVGRFPAIPLLFTGESGSAVTVMLLLLPAVALPVTARILRRAGWAPAVARGGQRAYRFGISLRRSHSCYMPAIAFWARLPGRG